MSWGAQLPSDEGKSPDGETMIRRLDKCTFDAIQYFIRIIKPCGQVGNETDLGSYAKLPNGLIFAGYPKEANLVLDYCKRNFFDEKTGDFVTNKKTGLKSSKIPFCIFYPYTNQWLIQAGLNLRRYDYVFKAAKFMDKFYNPKLGCSTIISPFNENGGNVHCLFNSAALGTTYLYLNNLERAVKIGNFMVKMYQKQRKNMFNSKDKVYYLRFNDNCEFLTQLEPGPGERLIYKVVGSKVKQAWFAIGYPIAFFGLLYKVTKDKKYLDTANLLLDYSINECNDDVRRNQWAHKLMWGASVIGTITNEQRVWDLCFDIATTIMDGQDPNTGKTSGIIDQSAEMAFWTPIISMNIRETIGKFGKIGCGNKLRAKL